MAATVEVTAQRVWQFGIYLNSEVWNDFHKVVRDQAGLQGCDKDGFTGLISPLQGSMDWLHGKTDYMLDRAVDRLHGVSDGLISSAYSYAGVDQHSRDRMNDIPDNHRPHDPQPTDGKGITFTTDGTPFHNPTPVVAKPISVEGKTVTEIMEGHTRRDADAVNWLVRNFGEHLGLGGKDLRQIVIEPLAGDFNQIRANGKAWADAGSMLNTILTNLGENAKKLVLSDWTGEAAQAFLEHVDVVWAGGLYVASRCAEIFDRLIGKIIAVAKRLIPGLGQWLMAFEWIASGFKDFPAWDDIKDIARMARLFQDHRDWGSGARRLPEHVKRLHQRRT